MELDDSSSSKCSAGGLVASHLALCNPMDNASQAPLRPWGFPSKTSMMGCLSFSKGDLPYLGMELMSPLVGGFFTTEPLGKPHGKGSLCINSFGLELLIPPENLIYQFRQ